MAQARTRSVSIKSVMYNRFFMKGYADVLAGRGFDPDYDSWENNTGAQWSYERGRHYAAATKGEVPVKTGKRVNYSAMRAFSDLYQSGAII